MTNNLFICLTPLHTLIAYLSSFRRPQDVIVLIDQNGVLNEWAKIVKEKNLFINFIYVNSKVDKYRLPFYYLGLSFGKLPSNFDAFIIKNKDVLFEAIYCFNDLAPQTQFLLWQIQHKEAVYIEDGSAPYNDHAINNNGIKVLLVRKLFSNFYTQIKVLGTSHYIERSLFMYPDFVRSENKIKPYSKLELSENKRQKIIDLFLTTERQKNLNENFCLVFTNLKISANELIKSAVATLGDDCTDNLRILIKDHPLSPASTNSKKYTIVDKNIPSELIPLLYPNVKYVFGFGTTALQNISLFYPNIKIFNFYFCSMTKYDKFLESLGVLNIYLNRIP